MQSSLFLLHRHVRCKLLHPWHLRLVVKSHFNCSDFTCCSLSSTLAIVNQTPFSPKVLDTPTSCNPNLDMESTVAPAGPLSHVLFITPAMELYKRLSSTLFSTSNGHVESHGLLFQQYPIQLSCHFPLEKNQIPHSGNTRREKFYFFIQC